MVLAAFDLNDQVTFSAVVFARNGDQALRLGVEHRASFCLGVNSQIACMERLPPLGGVARDRHLEAIEANVPGVGHWQPDGRWLILPPGVQPTHLFQPRPNRMFHFSDDDGYEVVLFARDLGRACELYEAILPDYRSLPCEWRGSEWETWSTIGMVRHAAQAEARGVEGVAIYNPAGWLILPLDYDAFGLEPPD
jgi:hypothetical protein